MLEVIPKLGTREERNRGLTPCSVPDNQPSIMDILAKKKAAPKPKPAAKEGPLRAAGDNAKGRKVMKRQPSSLDSDSDSDFGSKPAKSVASKVCATPLAPRELQRVGSVLLVGKAGGGRTSTWVWGMGRRGGHGIMEYFELGGTHRHH